jgi:hypothetical protein
MLHMLFCQFCAPCRLSRKFYAKTASNGDYVKHTQIDRLVRQIVLCLTDVNACLDYSAYMSAKYYTQFILTDTLYRDSNEFCGVVELNFPMEQDSDKRDIEAILASNFDLQLSAVKLVSWSRLH